MASSSPARVFWPFASSARTTSFITRARSGKLSVSSHRPAAWKNAAVRNAFAASAVVSAKPRWTVAPTATRDSIPRTASCSPCWNSPTCVAAVANGSLATKKIGGGAALICGLPTSSPAKPAARAAFAKPMSWSGKRPCCGSPTVQPPPCCGSIADGARPTPPAFLWTSKVAKCSTPRRPPPARRRARAGSSDCNWPFSPRRTCSWFGCSAPNSARLRP